MLRPGALGGLREQSPGSFPPIVVQLPGGRRVRAFRGLEQLGHSVLQCPSSLLRAQGSLSSAGFPSLPTFCVGVSLFSGYEPLGARESCLECGHHDFFCLCVT